MGTHDPAFLFYSNDFLSGVADLTMEERGQYITLMCLQHQKGHISEKTIWLCVGSVSVDVLSKFKQDENGCYYNERLEAEIEKRAKYTESRRVNGKKGGRKKNHMVSGSLNKNEARKNHTENENDNVIIDNDNEDIIEGLREEEKENKKKTRISQSDVDYLYSLYPASCPNRNKSTGKGRKDKEKIREMLKDMSKEELEFTIKAYVQQCAEKKEWLKNFSTFLNNLPDMSFVELKVEKPINDDYYQ